jgi:hypothetical protein
MKKQRWMLHLVLSLISIHTISAASDGELGNGYLDVPDEPDPLLHYQAPTSFGESIEPVSRVRKRRRPHYGPRMASFWGDVFRDMFVLNRNLFLWNSFKVLTTAFPIFVGARMIDEKLQNCFYDPNCHKNCNQMPYWCHDVAKVSIALPIVFLGLKGLLSRDPDQQYTSQIMLVGMPFVIWTKTLIKQIKFDACLRPWNEHFSCEQRAYGGFPSGHMAQAMYVTVLYGMRYGPRYSIPLSLLATALGVTFITCNRHYTSQIVAGAAFGAMYALAANTLVTAKMTDRVKLGFKFDEQGSPTFSLAFNF